MAADAVAIAAIVEEVAVAVCRAVGTGATPHPNHGPHPPEVAVVGVATRRSTSNRVPTPVLPSLVGVAVISRVVTNSNRALVVVVTKVVVTNNRVVTKAVTNSNKVVTKGNKGVTIKMIIKTEGEGVAGEGGVEEVEVEGEGEGRLDLLMFATHQMCLLGSKLSY